MHTANFTNAVITLTVITLYIMAMRSNRRALRAEAALSRVEVVVAEGILQPGGGR